MKQNVLVALGLAGILSGGALLFSELGSNPGSGDLQVQQINANMLRVKVGGQWEDLPLMPLADHLCRSRNRLFDRYCGDDVLAPEGQP